MSSEPSRFTYRAQASPGTLQLTGVLGLAALLYGLYALRGGRAQRPEEERRRRCGDNSGECAPGSSAKSNQQGPAGAAAPQAARPVRHAAPHAAACAPWRCRAA